MEDHHDPNQVVVFRKPKNETTPKYRHLSLNAEGIMYLNEMTAVTSHELAHQEQLKLLIITHLIESEALMDELPSSISSDSLSSTYNSSTSDSSDSSSNE